MRLGKDGARIPTPFLSGRSGGQWLCSPPQYSPGLQRPGQIRRTHPGPATSTPTHVCAPGHFANTRLPLGALLPPEKSPPGSQEPADQPWDRGREVSSPWWAGAWHSEIPEAELPPIIPPPGLQVTPPDEAQSKSSCVLKTPAKATCAMVFQEPFRVGDNHPLLLRRKPRLRG